MPAARQHNTRFPLGLPSFFQLKSLTTDHGQEQKEKGNDVPCLSRNRGHQLRDAEKARGRKVAAEEVQPSSPPRNAPH